MELLNKLCVHFMLPLLVRLNERFFAGASRRMPSAFDPPLDKALT
jgi:hypothetical protein